MVMRLYNSAMRPEKSTVPRRDDLPPLIDDCNASLSTIHGHSNATITVASHAIVEQISREPTQHAVHPSSFGQVSSSAAVLAENEWRCREWCIERYNPRGHGSCSKSRGRRPMITAKRQLWRGILDIWRDG